MKKFFYRTLTLNSIFLMLITAVLALIFFLGYDMFFQFSPTGALINDNTLIIIDSGHGGEDGGTSSVSGIVEKDINLSISKKLNLIFLELNNSIWDCIFYYSYTKYLYQFLNLTHLYLY